MTETIRISASWPACLAAGLLGACSTLPRDGGRSDLDALLAGRTPAVATATEIDDVSLHALLAEPLDAEAAVAVAWRTSPRVRMALAELGLAAADLFESGRPRNPALSAGRLRGSDGTTTVGISAMLGDLLSLPARAGIGHRHWQAAVARAAQTLVDEAAATRAAWYRYVAAVQIAELREAVSEAAQLSAGLAQRFHDTGNISALQLAREQAAASLARTEAARARSERFAARMALAERLGLAGRTNAWRTPARLPLPPAQDPALDDVLAQAEAQRPDLQAARTLLDASEDALALARRFAWLGEVEFGWEREHEDGRRRSGPHLSLQLPLFQQGQSQRTRARAWLELARGQVALLQLQLQQEVRTALARLGTQRQIIDTYREALLPQREAIVAREQERYNFMLIGAFALIQARQQEYDAYQAYLESIRDYWLQRVELARVAGGRLPGDDLPAGEAPALDDILRPSAGHGHHHH